MDFIIIILAIIVFHTKYIFHFKTEIIMALLPIYKQLQTEQMLLKPMCWAFMHKLQHWVKHPQQQKLQH
jgi:hypothetical protein